jgi:hypothetical protein
MQNENSMFVAAANVYSLVLVHLIGMTNSVKEMACM